MVSRSHLAAALVTLAVIGASVTLSARLTKQEADQFSAKLNRIVQTGNAKPVKTAKPVAAQPMTTQITDNELNAYFKYNAGNQIPVGIVEPTINALGDGRVGGRAVVDLVHRALVPHHPVLPHRPGEPARVLARPGLERRNPRLLYRRSANPRARHPHERTAVV